MTHKLRTLLFILSFTLLLVQLPSQSARAVNVFLCIDVTEISQVECEALVALYKSTNGAGWFDRNNWLETLTPSDWYGVTVDAGAVTQLILVKNGLSGTLPLELGSLINLIDLDLSGNQISGSIPPELGSLSNLSHLDLNSNQLSGVIPFQLGDMVNLSRLYLYDNMLSGPIPTSLGNLTHMWNLWLSGNQLTGPIPNELGQLSGMVFLRLADNELEGAIPEELGNLTALWQLSLGDNHLTGEIPVALSGMTSLLYLSLAGNQLSGSVPSQLALLTNLYELDLSDNQLSGIIPPELGNLEYLGILWLNQNQLTGDIPASLINLTYLELPGNVYGDDGLDLDYNALTVPQDYVNPDNPLHEFLSEYDPNWHTLQAFEQIIGAEGGVLTALDGSVSFDIPAGALSEFATFTFTPFPTPRYDPGELADAHHSFRLTAEYLSSIPVTTFNLPLTVTLTYIETDVLDLSEASLALYYWDSGTSAWLDAITTCSTGAYSRDPLANTLTLPLCHLSDYSLFGQPLQTIFLPLIARRSGGY